MSSTTVSTRAVLAGIVLIAVVGGIVAVWPSGSQETAPPVGHNASERIAALDGINATIETTIERAGETDRMVQEISMRPGTGEMRAETIAGNGSTLFVSNGSVLWMYDREANEVSRLTAGGFGGMADQQGERIERLFTRLNISRSAVDESQHLAPTSGIAPLPVVPAGQDAGTASPAAADADFGVRYNGTDTVDGREVYVLTLSTPTDAPGNTLGNYTQTMAVDSEWFLPLQTHTEWTLNGERVEVTSTYRNVTVNPGLDDALFEFEPPADATVDDIGNLDVRQYESVAALRANASVSVPDPAVPPSFELDAARSTSGQFRSLSLQYSNATAQVVISKSNVTNATAGQESDGERVSIDGREGTYRQIGSSALVSWSCQEYRYSVTGTGVSKALLVEVAESVACE